MKVEGPDEWAILMDDALADAMTYTPDPDLPGATPVSVTGFFTAANAAIASGEFPPVSTVAPLATLALIDLPQPPAPGDILEHDGTAYRVADTQPDGTGLVRLVLEVQ